MFCRYVKYEHFMQICSLMCHYSPRRFHLCNNLMKQFEHTERDFSGLQPKPQSWAICNCALRTWCQPQFMSLTTIPLVKPCRRPGGSKQTECRGDINCLWHSAAIGCTSLLHTITFIISFYGSSCSALLLCVPGSYRHHSLCLRYMKLSAQWSPCGFGAQMDICIVSKTV